MLQNNVTVTNDGSLSYYAGEQNKPYINIEAPAYDSSEGNEIINQLIMLETMSRMLLPVNICT